RDLSVNKRVVKARMGGVGSQSPEINARQTRPVNGAETHGTRLARCIEVAASEFEETQFLTGLADGKYLGMRRGIVGQRHPVSAFGENVAVFHDDSAKRAPLS